MSDKPDFMLQIFIRTDLDSLWEALLDPEHVAAYNFACNKAVTRPDGGYDVLREDESTMLSMRLISSEPKSKLEFSFEPNWGEEEGKNSRLVLLLEAEGSSCKLTVEHYQIPESQGGVREGWSRQFSSLKSYLETGSALKAPGV